MNSNTIDSDLNKTDFFEYIYALFKLVLPKLGAKYKLDWNNGNLCISCEETLMFKVSFNEEPSFEFSSGVQLFAPTVLSPSNYVYAIKAIEAYPSYMWAHITGLTETFKPTFNLQAKVISDIMKLHEVGSGSAEVLKALLVISDATASATVECKEPFPAELDEDEDDVFSKYEAALGDSEFYEDDDNDNDEDSDEYEEEDFEDDEDEDDEDVPDFVPPSPYRFVRHTKEQPQFRKYYLKTQHIFKMLNALNSYIVETNKHLRSRKQHPACNQIEYMPEYSDATQLTFSSPLLQNRKSKLLTFSVEYRQNYLPVDEVFNLFKDALLDQFMDRTLKTKRTEMLRTLLRKSKDLIAFINNFEDAE